LDVFAIEPRDVGFVNRYMINTDERNFEIIFSANFLISSNAFSANDKMLQFDIETTLDKENIGEIIVPRNLIDGKFTVLLNGEEISAKVSKSSKSSVISIEFDGKGKQTLDIIATKYLEIALEEKSNGGGCLIATAAFGSELAPQVQILREIRDKTVLETELGTSFMTGFNQFYYSFSPTIADYERENPALKEAVKVTLTPLLTSLTLLQYTDIDSEYEMLGYGIGVILLNIGIYFVVPAIIIMKIRKRVNMEKLDKKICIS
jgi:hypothetical protein